MINVPSSFATLGSVAIWGLSMLAVSVSTDENTLIETVRPYVDSICDSFDQIPSDRKALLQEVADYIRQRHTDGREAQLVFICTHNSRRSHLGQVWCQIAAAYYGVSGVGTYSGGTEATACNLRTIQALRRAGLSVVTSSAGDNPVYLIQYADTAPPIRAYSKIYSAEGNPQREFAAMMCCSDADEKCPMVSGAEARFALHYDDPKLADGTSAETARYDERSREIAREMFFILSRVAAK